jgi:hypothetical protein
MNPVLILGLNSVVVGYTFRRHDHASGRAVLLSMKKTLALACFAIFIPFASAYADQGGFTNSGGS